MSALSIVFLTQTEGATRAEIVAGVRERADDQCMLAYDALFQVGEIGAKWRAHIDAAALVSGTCEDALYVLDMDETFDRCGVSDVHYELYVLAVEWAVRRTNQ